MKTPQIYVAFLAGAMLTAGSAHAQMGMDGSGQGIGQTDMRQGMGNGSMQSMPHQGNSMSTPGNMDPSTMQKQMNGQGQQSMNPAGAPMERKPSPDRKSEDNR